MNTKPFLLIALMSIAITCYSQVQTDAVQSPPRRRQDFSPNQSDSLRQRRRQEFRFDETNPNVHDPVIAFENGTYYIFSTGMNVSTMTSKDLKTWKPGRPALPETPQWAVSLINGYRGHTWAPDIIHAGDKWYLYYSCSTFGKNTSAIGVAVNKTIDPESPDFKWEDLGLVISSRRGDNYNCIDPNVFVDGDGTPWMTFGSFWDGIQLVRLEKDMKTPVGKPVTIARHTNPDAVKEEGIEANNNEIEAPFIIKEGKYYYLFASAGLCCRGARSTYHTIVGRSKKIEGPYVDNKGKKMLKGAGTLLIGRDDKYYGVGHNGLANVNGQWIFVAHGYDRALNGASKLVVRKLSFEKGWPVLSDN